MPWAWMRKLGTMRLLDGGRDVAETEVGAGEADVPEEMIVELRKMCPPPARLIRLPAVPQECRGQATGEQKDGIRLRQATRHACAVTRRLEGRVIRGGKNGMQVGHRGCSWLALHCVGIPQIAVQMPRQKARNLCSGPVQKCPDCAFFSSCPRGASCRPDGAHRATLASRARGPTATARDGRARSQGGGGMCRR